MRTGQRPFLGVLLFLVIAAMACTSSTNPPPPGPFAASLQTGVIATPPSATLTAQATGSPTAVPTATAPPSPTLEPTKAPTREAIKEFDCGILSPKACASGEYIEWTNGAGGKSRSMAFKLKVGETISIPEDLHVAGVQQDRSGWLGGFKIAAPRKDGSGVYSFYGDITPVGIGRVGKALHAGTVVGTIADSGVTVFEGSDYNLVIIFPTKDELEKAFPDQSKTSPRTLNNTPVNSAPGAPGVVFFDVVPPKSADTPQNTPATPMPARPAISADLPVEECQKADTIETNRKHFQVLAKAGQLPPIRVSPDEDAQHIGTWPLNTELEFECYRGVQMRSGGNMAPWYRMSSKDGYHGWLSPVFDNFRALDPTQTPAR